MGFALIFILLPLSIIFFIIWLVTNNKKYLKIIGYLWGGLLGLLVLGFVLRFFIEDKNLDKSDYYGEYIINRNYFPGKQSDWQYDNFRFEIKENDSIYFYVSNKSKILKTYKGKIRTIKPFESERLIIKMVKPSHHILTSNPTTYRKNWNFNLVFYSPKFNNVYFKKGHWEPR